MKRWIVGVIGVLAACEDVPQPYELDHTRVMAIRVAPPALAPGSAALVEVLVTDAERGPRLAEPAGVQVTAPAGLQVAQTASGWEVTAPSESELVALRSALDLPADADVIVPLEIAVEVGDQVLVGSKTVAFGTEAANPAAPAILVDGVPAGVRMRLRSTSLLAVDAPDAALSYRWFSSIGDLIGYTTSTVRFDDPLPAEGMIGVVVRDQAGGVAWTLVPAEVQP